MAENNVPRETMGDHTTTRKEANNKWAQDRERAEEVGTWLAEAHAYQTYEFESDHTVEECQAWLTAYDHSVEQWVYEMPNPLEVWEEVYGDHTHDDHTRTYAWARAYAHAYRRETHALMSALVDAYTHEHTHAHEGDNNGVTEGDIPQPTHSRDTTDVTNS